MEQHERASWEPREVDVEAVSGLGELGPRKNVDDTTTRTIVHASTHLTSRIVGRVHGIRSGTYRGKPALVLVLNFEFIEGHLKIIQANVDIIFESKGLTKGTFDQKIEPIVKIICPSQLYGSTAPEEQKQVVDGRAQTNVSAGPVKAGFEGGFSKEKSSTKHHSFSILGEFDTDDIHDEPNKVLFHVTRNSVEDYFPRSVFFAVVIEQPTKVQAEISVWLNKSRWWSRLWAKDDPLWLPVGAEKGSLEPASLEFDKLTTEDWQKLVPFYGERQNIQFTAL